ncbi:MAG: hypothetical protein JWR69_4156 [Pedosphaera sp.]|nr:hypothetical protein [Pedosphaera sp.]
MSLSHFLAALIESGRVTISLAFTEEADAEAGAVLQEMDRITRLNLAGKAPEFRPEAALWAARLLHHGCQFLAGRDVELAVISQVLQAPCPAPHSPATDYSADLTLQYLPDLIHTVRQVATGDPLLQELLGVAREWPLSSVGVAGLEKLDVRNFISDPALRQLYVDRILAREDASRLDGLPVDQAVREALGAFPELCRALATPLQISGAMDKTPGHAAV